MSIHPSIRSPLVYGEDHTPSIPEFLNKTWITIQEFGIDRENKYPTDWVFVTSMFNSIKSRDVLHMFVAATVITLLRYFLNWAVYRPFCKYVNMRRQDSVKFPEAAWKFTVYVFTWSWTFYIVVLSGRHDFFHYPCRIWRGYEFNSDSYFELEIPTDIYWLYIVNFGYYLHSIYGTLLMDAWRKDSIMLLFHHFLTLFLLEFSFLIKYYRIGALVLLLHDISDVLLEFTKMNIYLKMRGNRLHVLNDFISSIAFVTFTISWGWFRIYWFSVKLLHSTNWCAYIYHKDRDPKLYTFFNVMLIFLQMLHIYWYRIILKLLYKVLTGQMKHGVEDTREYDVATAEEKRKKLT
jgi:sphingoid base N-stearoyltransferase